MSQSETRPTVGSWAAALAALVLVAGLSYGLWRAISSLGSATAAAVVTASATVLISVVSLIYSKRTEQRRAIDEAQREHKRAVYEEFITFWFKTLTASLLGDKQPSQDEIQRFMVGFNQKLILWGSDAFLRDYNTFRAVTTAASEIAPEGSPAMMFAFEQLLYAIRRDLGHSNTGLSQGDLLRVFINDIDAYLSSQATA